jgi:TolB-like protein/predicted Ser/Thr protein kinase
VTDDDLLRRANAVLDAALDLAPAERPAFVARIGDDALRATVEWLLRAHERAEGDEAFLGEPALRMAVARTGDDPLVGARPERVGPYRILREVGRGGMGTVYLGQRDDGEGFRQRVALKLVRGAFAADWLVSRFLAERRILASLEHPHVARLYDGGTAPDGTPWFAMEYVEGEPLDRWRQSRDVPLATRLHLFRDVCGAVQYAHDQGVVHRDLKPSNILVTAGGDAKLLDFGIAKLLDPAADVDAPRTRTGVHLMTPEYAAPEQLRGEPATVASDIYSLGVILYELVAGERPYHVAGLTPGQIERMVCDTAPARPSAVARRADPRARVDADLDTIILTAMHKEQARRYTSAARLLEDLERHERGQPIRARPDTAGYRARKFLGRHRVAAVTAATVLVAVPLSALAIAKLSDDGAPRFPTLLASGALHESDRVLVADFANRAGDSLLAAAVTEAVRIDLGQSPLVRVLTPRQVRVTLERMERSPDVALDDTLAREVAARDGVKAIVTGTVTRAGSAYTVAIELIGAERGEALAALRETASDSSRLITAIDRASKRLRERVGESLRDLRDMLPLEDAATGSLAALRFYTQGQREVYRGNRTNAIRFFERAIAIDTAFGSAQLAMSNV